MVNCMMKGFSEIRSNLEKSVEYIKLKNGESMVFRVAIDTEEIVSVYEHTEQFGGQWKTVTCLGKGVCPLCAAGKRASFKAYIPVIDIGTNKLKIFKANKSTVKDMLGLADEYGDLTACDFKVTRSGSGLDTSYQFFIKPKPTDLDLSSYEIPDLEEKVKPMTREAILAIMEGGESVVAAQEEGKGAVDTGEEDSFPF